MSLESLIRQELETDSAFNDCTTLLVPDSDQMTRGVVFAKAPGVFSGRKIIQAAKVALEGRLKVRALCEEGGALTVGDKIVEIEGTAAAVLGAERTLLNLLSHASGVATLTRQYVDATKPHSTRILATRKTLPGLREIQLDAVQAGGGLIHRRSLADGVLIKENHQMIVSGVQWIQSAREKKSPLHGIEIEIQDITLLKEVLEQRPDVVMLDNMNLETLAKAIKIIGDRARIEVSGGVSLDQVNAIAALGVHYISVGRLTHSAPALDLSLDVTRGH